MGALRGDRLPCRGSSHTSDRPRESWRFCIHPAHGRGSRFGTGIDLAASVPLYSAALVCLSGSTPSSRASLIQREAASSQCKRRRSSSAMIALRQQSSARPRYHSALVGDMPLKTASNELLIQGPGGAHGAAFCRPRPKRLKPATDALCGSQLPFKQPIGFVVEVGIQLSAWEIWWSQAGSNRRPRECHSRALPTELWPRSETRNQKPEIGWLAPALELGRSQSAFKRNAKCTQKPKTAILASGLRLIAQPSPPPFRGRRQYRRHRPPHRPLAPPGRCRLRRQREFPPRPRRDRRSPHLRSQLPPRAPRPLRG